MTSCAAVPFSARAQLRAAAAGRLVAPRWRRRRAAPARAPGAVAASAAAVSGRPDVRTDRPVGAGGALSSLAVLPRAAAPTGRGEISRGRVRRNPLACRADAEGLAIAAARQSRAWHLLRVRRCHSNAIPRVGWAKVRQKSAAAGARSERARLRRGVGVLCYGGPVAGGQATRQASTTESRGQMSAQIEAYPFAFYCENREGHPSAVFALVSQGGQMPVLVKTLEVEDERMSHRIACACNALTAASPGPALTEEVADIARQLPEGARSAFEQTAQRLIHRVWPSAPVSMRTIAEGPVDRFADFSDEEQRSPEQARLAEYTGPVVRLWRLTEVHVHDPDRLMDAALASGRLALEPYEQRDLLAAAAALADDERPLPGADTVLDTYNGSVLDPERDELADFRRVQAPEFDTGWRAGEVRHPGK